jgi:hypothetical protein
MSVRLRPIHLEHMVVHPGEQDDQGDDTQNLWLVQVSDTFDKKTFSEITHCNTYPRFHGHSFVCSASRSLLRLAQKTVEGIDWVGPHMPEYKVARGLIRKAHGMHHTENDLGLRVYIDRKAVPSLPDIVKRWGAKYPQTTLKRAGLQTITVTRGSPPLTTRDRLVTNKVHPHLDALLSALSREPETLWIEPLVPPRVRNAYAAPYVHGIAGIPPTTNQVITIGDTGLDIEHCYFKSDTETVLRSTLHPIPGVAIESTAFNEDHPKVLVYARFDTGDVSTDFADADGHGTHVMGSAVGPTGSAPGAKVIALDLGSGGDPPTLYVPEDLGLHIFNWVYPRSKIFSVSWGEDVNAYTQMAREMDAFVADHEDFIIIVASGNTGPGPGTVGSPATAKNVIAVGATFNSGASLMDYSRRDALWVDEGGAPFADGSGFNKTALAYFSSQGPTRDGRIKPDILAPGSPIASAYGGTGCDLMIRHGTSMAAPHVAGLVARIRDFYARPSAALVKAILIQSSTPVEGVRGLDDDGVIMTPVLLEANPPRGAQGFGAVRLGNLEDLFTLDDIPGRGRYTINTDLGGMLRATLAWTDPVAPLGAHSQLIHNNDLDIIHNGMRIYGNGGVRPDVTNNVEHIAIAIVPGDEITLQLHGDSERVALVLSHAASSKSGACDQGEVRTCRLAHGWGIQACIVGSWDACAFQECDSDYVYHKGDCAVSVRCHTPCNIPKGVGRVCGTICTPTWCDKGHAISYDHDACMPYHEEAVEGSLMYGVVPLMFFIVIISALIYIITPRLRGRRVITATPPTGGRLRIPVKFI